MSFVKCLLALAIVVTLTTSAFAINCYQCESAQNPKCGFRFEEDESMKKLECKAPRHLRTLLAGKDLQATGCMKQTLESKLGGIHVVRSCYFGDLENTQIGCQIDPNNVFMKLETCNVCSDNWCNGTATIAPMAAIIMAIFCLTRIFS